MRKFDVAKDERGVALVLELISVALVAGVVAIVGYRAWQSHHKAKPVAVVQTTPVPTPASASTTQYLKITQLGIQMPASGAISDLSYTFNSTTGGVELGSATLMKDNNQENPSSCQSTNSTSLVSKIVSSTTASSTSKVGYWLAPNTPGGPDKIVTVGGQQYYWYAPGSGSGCSDPAATFTAQLNSYYSAALSAFGSATAIK